ncbi:hypothetical protein [Rhizobium sp. HT1-10]|uniref:hypothetical protein n=1 Tax=Rhizobium sp. HT1-10 TaxID=3111638 RepID=UPI003C27C029
MTGLSAANSVACFVRFVTMQPSHETRLKSNGLTPAPRKREHGRAMKENDQDVVSQCVRLVAVNGKLIERPVPPQAAAGAEIGPKTARANLFGYLSLLTHHLVFGFKKAGEAQCVGLDHSS